VNRNELLNFPLESEPVAVKRCALAPPVADIPLLKSALWNEHVLRAGWRLAIYVFFFGVIAAAASLLSIALHLPQVSRTAFRALGRLVQQAVGRVAAVAAAAILGRLEGRPLGAYGLPAAEAFRAKFWHGIAWGIAMISAIILLISMPGGFSFGGLALHGAAAWDFAVVWAMVFLCVGFFEEFLFRGYSQFTLSSGLGFWPAASVLSAAFGALHLSNRGEDRVGALSVFVIGMFFCLTLRRTGNLWFAVGLHAAFDWGETFLFSVPNSGIVVYGHLLNSSFHGPVWLTGGTVGPEGSVMSFVVVAIAALIFSRVYPPREA